MFEEASTQLMPHLIHFQTLRLKTVIQMVWYVGMQLILVRMLSYISALYETTWEGSGKPLSVWVDNIVLDWWMG